MPSAGSSCYVDNFQERLAIIERGVDNGSYTPGLWQRLIDDLRQAPPARRATLADDVSRISRKLHLRHQRYSWRVLLAAQKQGQVATAGPYGYIRHPQYAAFILVMLGFLVQWQTIITAVMFPILWVLYARLAISEERDSVDRFGLNYVRYAEHTPRFIPTIGRSAQLYNVARPVNEA